MEATIVRLPVRTRLTCSKCGADGEGSCDCGVAYAPGDRAVAAIADNPARSDRAIAEEIGVDHKTVAKARKKTRVGDSSPTAKRTGKDGKSYKAAKPKPKRAKAKQASALVLVSDTPCDDCTSEQERWQRSVMNMAGEAVSLPAYWSLQFGNWKELPVTTDLIKLARQAADVWTALASDFERRRS